MEYNIVIDELRKHPEYLLTVVQWLYDEWGTDNKQYWTSWVQYSLQADDIPKTYVLFIDGRIAGTYSLWRCDLQSRQDLFPWFGGLYVDKKYRGKAFNGQKLGIILQKHAFIELKKMGYKQVYLFTSKQTSYYSLCGWSYYCHAPDETDKAVEIYKHNI